MTTCFNGIFLFFIRKFLIFSGDFFLRFIGTSWPFSTEKSIFLYGIFFTVIQRKSNYFYIFHFFLIRKNLYRKSTTLRGQKLSALKDPHRGLLDPNSPIKWQISIDCQLQNLFYFPHPHTKYVRKVVSFIEKSMSVRGNDNSKTTWRIFMKYGG